jgi:alkanesulfonate monooxygenase SsuD/methylene tetrahydromethanopterin reductase-like flavin-dependent oxidoreductase (luciferase family)
MSSAATLDADCLSFGYLLPTREAIMFNRSATAPLLGLAEQAEQLGFDAIWAGDGPLARPRHDALVMLTALAARTDRVVLGTGVLLGALRPALLLAQATSTLDQISEGRFVLGLGAGFPFPETERQFEAVGVPYTGRVGRLAETIAALRLLWQAEGEPIDFHGRHIQLSEVALQPVPYTAGGPRLWLAGAGETAERRVGRVADGWLPYLPSPQLYEEGLARVRATAAQAGRERAPVPGLYATVALDSSPQRAQERLADYIQAYYGQPVELIAMIQAMYAGTPEGLLEWLSPYLQAGARHVVLRVADEDPQRGLQSAAQARELIVNTWSTNRGQTSFELQTREIRSSNPQTCSQL